LVVEVELMVELVEVEEEEQERMKLTDESSAFLQLVNVSMQLFFSSFIFFWAPWESQAAASRLAAVVMLAAAFQQAQAAAPSVVSPRQALFLVWMALYTAWQVSSRVKLAVLLGTAQEAGIDTVQLSRVLIGIFSLGNLK